MCHHYDTKELAELEREREETPDEETADEGLDEDVPATPADD